MNAHDLSSDGGLARPRCARQQHLKHDAGWTVQLAANGTVTWTSPTGRHYDKPPDTYPIDRTSPTTTPARPPF